MSVLVDWTFEFESRAMHLVGKPLTFILLSYPVFLSA
jgi:hypothetical protein